MLECTKCKQPKLPEEMSKDRGRKNGLSSWCKLCRSDSIRTWSQKNTGRTRKKYTKDYQIQRDYMLKARYGLQKGDYEKMLESQNYSCAICKRDSREMTYHLHVDHCHTTGKVRGLLCSPCNVFLGYSNDSTELFKNAVLYLEENS